MSSVLRPEEYSIRLGDLASELTNQGSLLMSPVYSTALPWPSNTEDNVSMSTLGLAHTDWMLTKHDCAGAVVCIEQGDLKVVSRLELEECGGFQGYWFLREYEW